MGSMRGKGNTQFLPKKKCHILQCFCRIVSLCIGRGGLDLSVFFTDAGGNASADVLSGRYGIVFSVFRDTAFSLGEKREKERTGREGADVGDRR
jgi:hypothetical protein